MKKLLQTLMEKLLNNSSKIDYQELIKLLHQEITDNYKNIKDFCVSNGITNYNGVIKLLNGEYQPKKICTYLSLFGYKVEESKCFKVLKQKN